MSSLLCRCLFQQAVPVVVGMLFTVPLIVLGKIPQQKPTSGQQHDNRIVFESSSYPLSFPP